VFRYTLYDENDNIISNNTSKQNATTPEIDDDSSNKTFTTIYFSDEIPERRELKPFELQSMRNQSSNGSPEFDPGEAPEGAGKSVQGVRASEPAVPIRSGSPREDAEILRILTRTIGGRSTHNSQRLACLSAPGRARGVERLMSRSMWGSYGHYALRCTTFKPIE
jgi:hypothetical protein